MSLSARVASILLLGLVCVRLTAAEPEEIAALRSKAEQGNALAQYNLGLAYLQGRQVPPDMAEALAWLTLASEGGATGKALDSLLGSITDAQLSEGRRRLTAYRNALAAHYASLPRSPGPKLAPRGFTIENPPTLPVAPPPTLPETTPASGNDTPPSEAAKSPDAKSPDVAEAPAAASPAAGVDPNELAQTKKDLEKARADLQAANAELADLRNTVALLKAAADEARATENRLTSDLLDARQQLSAVKSPAPPAAKPSPETTPANQP